MNILSISCLAHTWLIDLDGTILKHNGYKIDGYDSLLEGAREFLSSIPSDDKIIFLTARTEKYRQLTINFLNENDLKFDHIIFDLPFGERILINDKKTSGLNTAIAVNTERDKFCTTKFNIDQKI